MTSPHQNQDLFRFLLQGRATFCRFIRVHAINLPAYFFYSLGREFSSNPGSSCASLPSVGPGYFSFATFRPGQSLRHGVATERKKMNPTLPAKLDSSLASGCHLLTKAWNWSKRRERRVPWTKRGKRSRKHPGLPENFLDRELKKQASIIIA